MDYRDYKSIYKTGCHADYEVLEFAPELNITHEVSKSQTSESVYITYRGNGKSVTVRFAYHANNAVKFGKQLIGLLGCDEMQREQILIALEIIKRKYIEIEKPFIGSQQIAKKKMKFYEEAKLTIQEMYELGIGADLSEFKGKLAKGSNYLITGEIVRSTKEGYYEIVK